MIINNKSITIKIVLFSLAVLCNLIITPFSVFSRNTASLQTANVTIKYLPARIVAAARGDKDVPIEIELIFNETKGVGVSFDQLKRSFIIPNATTIDAPVKFENLALHPAEELHLKITEIIPQNVVMLAMGGRSSADIKIKIVYTGVDTYGNSIAAEIEIPVEITNLTAVETFAIGDVGITSPKQNEKFKYGSSITAIAEISTTGIGSISGIWLLNGQNYKNFTQDSTGQGKIKPSIVLPANLKGKNTIELKITQPMVKSSAAVTFEIAITQPTGNLNNFFAGAFNVTNISAVLDDKMGTFAGKGSLLLPVFDIEVPLNFKDLSITNISGKTKLKSGSVLQDANITIERGTIKLEITGLLLTADGVWIDGKISVSPSIMTPGIGPLFIYAVPFKENGVNSKVLLKEAQKGRQGDYEVSVNQFEFKMGRTSASLTVHGVMTKPTQPAWKIPLKLTISFGEEK